MRLRRGGKIENSKNVVMFTAFRRFAINEHIKASDANRQFSQLLQRVRKGESFVITSHGKPVAEIKPVEADEERERRKVALKRLFERLDSQPVVNIGKWTRDELNDD